jgi:hypothetical protein
MTITEGWEGLRQVEPQFRVDNQQSNDDIDRLYLRVFGSDDGQELLAHLRALTIEQPTWYPAKKRPTAMPVKDKTHLSAK